MASEKRPSSLYLDLKELREKFEEADGEGKGYIDRDGLQEMTEGFDIDELMRNLDRDQDGKVTWEDLQTLFTLERDVVKSQRQQICNNTSGSNSESTSPYMSAVEFQQQQQYSPTRTYFSPDKPPVPKGNSRTFRRGSGQSLTQVPRSPDLADHARSLRGTVLHSPVIDPRRLSLASDPGDLCLEDTGSIGIGPSPLPSPITYPRTDAFELMAKELTSLSPSGYVSRENILQFCKKFGNDSQDKQYLLTIWENLNKSTPNRVTVDAIMHMVHENETSSFNFIVTSTPAPYSERFPKQGWKEDASKLAILGESFGTPISPAQSSPTTRLIHAFEDVDDAKFEPDEAEESSSGDSLPPISHIAHPLRPKSASRVGDRLSKGGYTESSIVVATDYKKLQEKYHHLSQERDSLRASLSRAEEEKKRVIHEGDEDVQKLQNQKESEISKLQEEYQTRLKDIERSFIDERELLQEKATERITSLEEQIRDIKKDDEALRDDLHFYQQDRSKLIDELQAARNLVKQGENKIELLHKVLGFQTDPVSEADIEKQAAHISELESHVQELEAHNQLLKDQNLELNDRVDEMKAECEGLKLKITGEKRKRQRRKSGGSTPTKTSSAKKRRNKEDGKRLHRKLPQLLATPVATQKKSDSASAETDSLDITDEGMELYLELESEDLSITDDSSFEATGLEMEDIQTQLNENLMDELQIEDHKHAIGEKLHALESQRSMLEASCQDLRTQLEGMKDTKVALRKEIEEELKRRMFQRAKLDKHLKQLKMLKEGMAIARKQFTDKMMFNEDYIAQYMEGLETDIGQMIDEDAETGMSQTTAVRNLHNQIKLLQSQVQELQSQLKENETECTEQRQHIRFLEGQVSVQSAELQKAQQQLRKSQSMHTEEVDNLRQALLKQESFVSELQAQAELQKKEHTEVVAALTADLEHERNERLSATNQQAKLLQNQTAVFSAQQQSNTLQQEKEQLKSAVEALEADNKLLQTQVVTLQQSYQEVQQKFDRSESVRRAMEAKLEGHERELKSKKTEAALAIHDLAQKEQEIDHLDDKLEKMKRAQEDHLTTIASLQSRDNSLTSIAEQKQEQLQNALVELQLRQSELEKLASENQQLLAKRAQSKKELEDYVSNLNRSEQEISQLKEELEQYHLSHGNSPMHMTTSMSPPPSPSSTTYSTQSAIMAQLKAQLTSLQRILSSKGGEEITDSELSVTQELLAINASLREKLQLQEEQYNRELAKRRLQMSHTSAPLAYKWEDNFGLIFRQQLACAAKPLQNVPNLMATLSKRIASLSSMVCRIHQTMTLRDSQQVDALDGLLSDIESTRAERNKYREEIDLLTSSMEMSDEVSHNQPREEQATPAELNLTKEVNHCQSELEQRMKEIEEEKKKNENTMHRQNEQLKKLNFQLGKAASLKERYDYEQQQRDKEILNKSIEIKQLREEIQRCRMSSLSEPFLLPTTQEVKVIEQAIDGASPTTAATPDTSQGPGQMREELRRLKEAHAAELLMQQESLQAAEGMITVMRGQLHDLHQDLVNPSDSSAADLLDPTEMIAQIRKRIDDLKFEFHQLEGEEKNLEKELSMKTSEYDSLYVEHDEEVRALEQQKEQMMYQLEDMEDRFQHLLSAHEKQLLECRELSGNNANLLSLLQDRQEECKRAQAMVNELETQKHVLVDLVHRLSQQVVQALSGFVQ